MEHPDITVRGIRFHWDHDAAVYEAQVSPDDIEDVYDEGYSAGHDAGYDAGWNQMERE